MIQIDTVPEDAFLDAVQQVRKGMGAFAFVVVYKDRSMATAYWIGDQFSGVIGGCEILKERIIRESRG